MNNRLKGLRQTCARDAAQHEEALRAAFGGAPMDSRAARVGRAGLRLGVFLTALRPAISLAFMLCVACVGTAFGQNTRPLDADSGMVGRMAVSVIKWLIVLVLVASIGTILWAVLNGMRGEPWQGKLAWGVGGFCTSAGGIIAWAMDIGEGRDPAFDVQELGS